MTPGALSPSFVRRILHAMISPDCVVKKIDYVDAGMNKDVRHSIVVRVTYTIGTEENSVILKVPRYMANGDHHVSNQVRTIMWQRDAFNRLPAHCTCRAAGLVNEDGSFSELNISAVPFIIEEDIAGDNLFHDFIQAESKQQSFLLTERIRRCGEYIGEIHSTKKNDQELQLRVVREYTGRFLRLVDEFQRVSASFIPFRAVIDCALCWHWRLRDSTERLRMVHGDFHPGNIIFTPDNELRVIDRKHIEWGDPADDLAAFFINILFFSLRKYGRMHDPYIGYARDFFGAYLRVSPDIEIDRFLPPFLLTRLLVLLNPQWYPGLDHGVIEKLGNVLKKVLTVDELSIDEFMDLHAW